jgi:CheY-like chemotaxis protein/DNA-directed RNA polymerase specialized sigma24 family protein
MAKHSHELIAHIPYLRRYVRSLLGSQSRGDRYVQFFLEFLLEDSESLPPGPTIRTRIFRLFHAVLKRIHSDNETMPDSPEEGENTTLDQHIQNLPGAERQVLLLAAVEEFSIADVAYILDLSGDIVEQHLMTARDMLCDQAATTVLVIEDEPVIAFDIERTIEEMGHTVVATATTKDEAVAFAKAERPGIVLADIQLDDGSSGIDAVREILESIDIPVVFVTAFPERLLTGKRREPAFLVTKPFDTDVLKVTIYQALLTAEPPPARAA